MSEIHRTNASDVAIPADWRRIGEVEISEPAIDGRRPHLLARLTSRDAHAVAELRGYLLPTREQIHRARETADRVLEPISLPTLELARRYGVAWTGAATQALRTREMRSVAWSEYHDEILTARIGDFQGSVFGKGKHWRRRLDGKQGDLCGWYTEHLEAYSPGRKGAGYVQQGLDDHEPPHDPDHHDYATTTLFVRPFRPSWFDQIIRDADEVLTRAFRRATREPLGERANAWGLTFEGLSEIPGPTHRPEILAWGKLCRRGGVYLGKQAGKDLWTGTAAPVGAPTDEEAWCAKFASACLQASLRDDEAPPHGLRVSVAELATDARALGSLRMPGYTPRPGDLALFGRLGANPLKGGTGHVARVLSVDPYVTLGGNEAPGPGQVHRTPRVLGAEVGWIAYP